MSEMGSVTVSLWPATPLPVSVAWELGRAGVDVRRLPEDARLELTQAGGVGLRLPLRGCAEGLGSVEALLATMRLAGVSYLAWDSRGRGRRFEAGGRSEEPFAVGADGRAVITDTDLDGLDRGDDGPVLLDRLRGLLGRATPPFVGRISERTAIAVFDDDCGYPAELPGDGPWVLGPAGVVEEVEL